MVLVRSHAERIMVLFNDEVVADHPREFRRDQGSSTVWHYLPVLVRKPARYAMARHSRTGTCPPA